MEPEFGLFEPEFGLLEPEFGLFEPTIVIFTDRGISESGLSNYLDPHLSTVFLSFYLYKKCGNNAIILPLTKGFSYYTVYIG